jgi:hypothetical protein
MIKKILLNINFIINPMWWFMSEKYDKNWDKKINELLDKNEFKVESDTRASIGKYSVWIGNYPYYYGIDLEMKWIFEISEIHYFGRPSRSTIWRIRQRYKWDKLSKEDKRNLRLNQII